MRKSLQKTSILIIRLGDTGDIVLASPVAETIRHQNPNAYICWLIENDLKEALEGNPHIDEVITWDRELWRTRVSQRNFPGLINEARRLRQQLKQHHFDLALDLHGSMLSGFLAWLSGAKKRISLGSREGSNMLMTRTISRNLGDQVQVGAEYRYFMYQLGYPEFDWQMYVPLTQHASEAAKALINSVIANENYAVICPFSNQPQNLWFRDYWHQLILRIRGRYQLKTIILGDRENTEKAQDIARLCGAISLVGQTSFQEACAIIKGASLVVGVDTGLTHVGHALKIPTISLFGSTCPYSHTGQESSTVIYLDKVCSPCAQSPSCKGKYDCMKDISPDQVLTEIKPLMKNFYEPIKIKVS